MSKTRYFYFSRKSVGAVPNTAIDRLYNSRSVHVESFSKPWNNFVLFSHLSKLGLCLGAATSRRAPPTQKKGKKWRRVFCFFVTFGIVECRDRGLTNRSDTARLVSLVLLHLHHGTSLLFDTCFKLGNRRIRRPPPLKPTCFRRQRTSWKPSLTAVADDAMIRRCAGILCDVCDGGTRKPSR